MRDGISGNMGRERESRSLDEESCESAETLLGINTRPAITQRGKNADHENKHSISNIYRYLRVDSIHFGKSGVKLLLRVVCTDATQESCVNGGVTAAVAGPVSDAEVSQDRGPLPPGQTPGQRPRPRLRHGLHHRRR